MYKRGTKPKPFLFIFDLIRGTKDWVLRYFPQQNALTSLYLYYFKIMEIRCIFTKKYTFNKALSRPDRKSNNLVLVSEFINIYKFYRNFREKIRNTF